MAKRKLFLLFFLSVLAVGMTGNAHAGLFGKKKKHKKQHVVADTDSTAAPLTRYERRQEKKKEKKERKKLKHERKVKRKEEKYAVHHKSVAPVVKKKQMFVYRQSVIKPRYRIDVLAQLYLDEVKDNKIPAKAQAGITFYEGLTIAADSLKKAGYNIDIYVHDVASAAESAEMLVKNNALDSSDLIIAAVYAQDIPVLAAYAKSKEINFVSALSASDAGVTDNQYFTLIQPSLQTHCAWITSDIAHKFPGMKVGLLCRTTSPPDADALQYLTGDDSDRLTFSRIDCNTLPDKSALSAVFDSTRPNVVIIPVLDPAYADSLLRELSHDFPATHFEVYGMPSWSSIAGLHKDDGFPNLSINITTPFNIDENGTLGKYISRTFKRDYSGHATELTYRGFEALYWYASLLKQYGTIFNANYNDNAVAPFTRFDVKPKWDKDGNVLYLENTHLFSTRYEGGMSKTE